MHLWHHIPARPTNLVNPLIMKHLFGDQLPSMQITSPTYNDFREISQERKLIIHLTLACPPTSLTNGKASQHGR